METPQPMQQQFRSMLQTWRAALFMASGFLPALVGLFVGEAVSLPWKAAVAGGALLGVGLVFLLEWRHRPEQPTGPLWWLITLSLAGLSALFFVQGMPSVAIFQQQRLDTSAVVGTLALVSVLCFYLTLLGLLVHQWGTRYVPSDGPADLQGEIKRAFVRTATGWGMTPREAGNRGLVRLLAGVVVGGFWIGEGMALLSALGFFPQQWPDWLYLGLGSLMVIGGLWLLARMCLWGGRLLRIWWLWRERPQEIRHIEATLEGMWSPWVPPVLEDGSLSLFKVHLPDGSHRLWAAKNRVFQGNLFVEGESISFDYLPGTEAVVRVTGNGMESENMPAEQL